MSIIMYHYEFDDINDLSKLIVKISLPKLNNARWSRFVAYDLIEKVTVNIFVMNDILLDKTVYRPTHYYVFQELDTDTHETMNHYSHYYPTSEPCIIYYPLFPNKLSYMYNYLNSISIPYRIVCDIETCNDIQLNKLAIPYSKDTTPYSDGDITIDIFMKDNEEKDDVIDIDECDTLVIYI